MLLYVLAPSWPASDGMPSGCLARGPSPSIEHRASSMAKAHQVHEFDLPTAFGDDILIPASESCLENTASRAPGRYG